MNTDGLTQTNKKVGNNNPIASQRFMADPYAIEYKGTVYVYGTNDSQQMQIGEDGQIPKNTYNHIKSLNCYSSKDMVNWTDEGIIEVAGENGPAKWANNCWAPAIAHKVIDGKDKFFIYFADNGSGVGVVVGDSPVGPFVDPLGKQIISRDVPNCSGEEVPWLFDPAVLVDDDGTGYLYFGGIGDAKDREHPNCIRVVKLQDDMIHLDGDPIVIDAPGAFEDSGINKIGNKYYYSYCTNWDQRSDDLGVASIAYMTSDSPMGPWSEAKVVLISPSDSFPGQVPANDCNNNHHCIFERNGQLYIFYHSQKTAAEMGITQGYRTTGVNFVNLAENGDISAKMDMIGVPGDADFNPYDVVEAETFAWSEKTSTVVGPKRENRNNRVLSSIEDGSYVGLESVAFGENGASQVKMCIASENATGTVDIYIDTMEDANKVGTVDIAATGSKDSFQEMSAKLTKTITGTHRLFFVYHVEGIYVDTWTFA